MYKGVGVRFADFISNADPEGGTGGPDPPVKSSSFMGIYRE